MYSKTDELVTDENSVSIELVAEDPDLPLQLTLCNDLGEPIDVINVPASKQYIKFKFPSDEPYSHADIRVFEPHQDLQKLAVIAAFHISNVVGHNAFEGQFNGQASSGGDNAEFSKVSYIDNVLTVRDRNLDGEDHKFHSFIIQFIYDGTKVLFDPKIRNTGRQ